MQQEHAYSTADVPTKGYVASLTTIHCHLIEVAALCGERGTSRKGGQTNLLPRREMGRAIGNVSPSSRSQRQVLPSGHDRRGSSEAYPYSARKDVVRQSPPTGQPTNRSAKL